MDVIELHRKVGDKLVLTEYRGVTDSEVLQSGAFLITTQDGWFLLAPGEWFNVCCFTEEE
jgi:hypothetical protein